MSKELCEYRQVVPDLEDKIVGLQAEAESQDKCLRYCKTQNIRPIFISPSHGKILYENVYSPTVNWAKLKQG